jgi:hypothetical protein
MQLDNIGLMNQDSFQNNRLLNGFNRFQNSSRQYGQYGQNEEKIRINNLYQQINRLKGLQQIKQLEKYNELDKFVDKDRVKESVITSIKIVKPSVNEINNGLALVTKEFNSTLQQYWNGRTNQPYKNILKNENYEKIPLRNAKKEDLIVHKVTDADKIGLLDEFNELIKMLEKHNNELTVIYSTSKELEHKKKFAYHNTNKFNEKYDPADFKKMKKDKVKFYQKEQKKLEADKKRVDDLIEAAMLSGSLSKEDVEELERNQAADENMDDLLKGLKKELGNDYDEKLVKGIMTSVNKDKDKDKDKDEDDRSSDDSDGVETIEVKPIKNNSVGAHKDIKDIKDKYRSRQKRL